MVVVTDRGTRPRFTPPCRHTAPRSTCPMPHICSSSILAAPWIAMIGLIGGLCPANAPAQATGPEASVEAGTEVGEFSFSRDVLPILSDRCFHCHGPDEADRQAGLRLDLRQAAVEDRGGYAAVQPGDADDSELIVRITSDDPNLLMPPADAHRQPLSEHEVQTLHRWIDAGAAWGRHWAFEPPQQVELDTIQANPIDLLVGKRLQQEGLPLSPPASKATLLRRLSLDLTGLPPTLEQLEAFLDDPSPEAYQRQVDALLESPHHGERMAMWWLDAARYSDTDGFQQDKTRSNWPWRDWVVAAFNDNMPLDRFTLLQLAGDLLPDAEPEDVLATCFHRNHMTNGEGGRDPEESRIDYVIDRVNTMGTVWLGMTLGCVQCHSHKFDPISHEDYYRLFAFFNSIDEDGRAGSAAKPYLKYQSALAQPPLEEAQRWADQQERIEREARQAAAEGFPDWLDERIAEVAAGFSPWRSLELASADAVEGTELQQLDDGSIVAEGPNPRQEDYRIAMHRSARRITALRLEVLADPSHTLGKYARGTSGNFILTNVKLQVRSPTGSQVHEVDIETALANVAQGAKGRNYGNVVDTLDDDPRNGWTLPAEAIQDDDDEQAEPTDPPWALFVLDEPLQLADDEELVLWLMHRSTDGDANIGRFRVTVTDQGGPAVRSLEPMPIEQLAQRVAEQVGDAADEDELRGPPKGWRRRIAEQIDDPLHKRLIEQFLHDHPDFQRAKGRADAARRHLAEMQRGAGQLDVMVLAEREEPRPTHVLVRGVWDQHGKQVEPGFPEAIFPGDELPPERGPLDQHACQDDDQPRPGQADERSALTRIDLAHWLVSDDNPLTPRVMVNHLWQIAFGDGLVRTPEDFGLQGQPPTHPELLDWLAVELVESGWDLRHILRLIVTSDVYRQRSDASAELIERDPDNRLLVRGARYRLPSWMIRDAALQASGLLNPMLGGPPVYPYQPPGVWEEIFMGRFRYHPSPGPAQYRRTLYAFWRRSSSPTFLFDSAQRRVCEVQLARTNTPLHALTLLNDTTMLEASVALAQRAAAASEEAHPQIDAIFRRVLLRHPDDDERAVLAQTYQRTLAHYRERPSDAEAILAVGPAPLATSGGDGASDAAHTASMAVVASTILNLDEAITHE